MKTITLTRNSTILLTFAPQPLGEKVAQLPRDSRVTVALRVVTDSVDYPCPPGYLVVHFHHPIGVAVGVGVALMFNNPIVGYQNSVSRQPPPSGNRPQE